MSQRIPVYLFQLPDEWYVCVFKDPHDSSASAYALFEGPGPKLKENRITRVQTIGEDITLSLTIDTDQGRLYVSSYHSGFSPTWRGRKIMKLSLDDFNLVEPEREATISPVREMATS